MGNGSSDGDDAGDQPTQIFNILWILAINIASTPPCTCEDWDIYAMQLKAQLCGSWTLDRQANHKKEYHFESNNR